MALVDARGMRCPWPALRLARAMRALDEGDAVTLLADDPAAEGEIRALATTHDWHIASDGPDRWKIARRSDP